MCALLGGEEEEEVGGGAPCACSVYSWPLCLCCLFTLRGSADNRVLCRILLLSPRCNQTSRPRLVLAALPQRRCVPFLCPPNCFQSLNFDRCSATIFFELLHRIEQERVKSGGLLSTRYSSVPSFGSSFSTTGTIKLSQVFSEEWGVVVKAALTLFPLIKLVRN